MGIMVHSSIEQPQIEARKLAIRTVLIYPDPRLRAVAKRVEVFDKEIQQIVNDMAETMYASNGIGLASIQVNVPKSIIVVDMSANQDELQVLINPEIIDREDVQEVEEGCLSFPGYFETVKRSKRIRFRAQDQNGKEYEKEAEDMFAACVQHEIDHLSGKLFADYLSRLKRERVKRQFEKQARARKREGVAA